MELKPDFIFMWLGYNVILYLCDISFVKLLVHFKHEMGEKLFFENTYRKDICLDKLCNYDVNLN